jgi:DNA polymerase-1
MTGETLKMLAGMFPGTPLEEAFDALSDYKKISKYLSSFGETLITKANLSPDGRVRARFNIGAAKTLRFSSSGPNVQQIPRDKDDFFGETLSIRQSFVAGMGRRIVALDYSGIELRVLGLLAGDDQLIEDAVQGRIHDKVAEYMAGRPVDKRVPADNEIRTKAKGVSFGTVYGSGAAGLASTLRRSVDEAQDLLDFWAGRYPKAFNLRHDKLTEAERTRYIRMVDGGTVYMGKKPELPKCANYPVQRAAWSIMARAIKRHHDTLQGERAAGRQRMTRMIGTIHDELLDEASSRDADACYALLERDMTDAYLDIFPGAPTENLVEGGIGKTWGDVK